MLNITRFAYDCIIRQKFNIVNEPIRKKDRIPVLYEEVRGLQWKAEQNAWTFVRSLHDWCAKKKRGPLKRPCLKL